jgi:hypothetical protein
MKKYSHGVLFSLAGYAVLIGLLQSVQQRSFWLDEAFIWESLATKSLVELLVGGPLAFNQQFPRLYLALVQCLSRLTAIDLFWTRALPLTFGIGSIAVWFWTYYEHFAVKSKTWVPCILAAGLFIANGYFLYFLYELKQYSAELFFSGLLFALFQTHLIRDSIRRRLLAVSCLVAPLFTYTGWFVIAAIAAVTVIDIKERADWGRDRTSLALLTLLLPIFLLLNSIDYEFARSGSTGEILRAYWAHDFPAGAGGERVLSLLKIYERFLTGWWRTEYGVAAEPLLGAHSWFIPQWRPFKNPDLRNFLSVACMVFMFRPFLRRNASRSAVAAAAGLIAVAATAAYFGLYPWGVSRLSLYAMPVAALTVVECLNRFHALLAKLRFSQAAQAILWAPFAWQVMRNLWLFAFMFYVAPWPENLKPIFREVSENITPFIVVEKNSAVIVKSYPKKSAGWKILYEAEMGTDEILHRVGGRPFYYLSVHFTPLQESLLASVTSTHGVQEVIVPVAPGGAHLSLCSPIK